VEGVATHRLKPEPESEWHGHEARRRQLERRGGSLHFLQAVLSEVRLGKGSRVLEVGCGTGVLAEYFSAATGADFFGTEMSEARALAAGERVRCVYSPGGELPRALGPFDLIYCKDVMPEVGDKRKFYTDVCSCLAEGGVFCTYLPEDNDLTAKPLFRYIPCGLDASRDCYGGVEENVRLLCECGLGDVRTRRLSLGTVQMDEEYVRRHWDGYFSNSHDRSFDEERRDGLTRLRDALITLSDFGILAHYEWVRTLLVARR
jgi:SAM-dependent methyltransferase